MLQFKRHGGIIEIQNRTVRIPEIVQGGLQPVSHICAQDQRLRSILSGKHKIHILQRNKNQSVRIMIPIAVVYPVNLAFFILYVSPWNLESSFSGRRDQVLIPAVIFQKSKVFFVPKTFPKIFFYFPQIFLFYFFKLHMLIEG